MRPTKDQYFCQLAQLTATRSTCLRRAVGCVLVNRLGQVLSTGYNGVARGLPHCNEVSLIDASTIEDPPEAPRLIPSHPHACQGARAKSGEGLDACQAIHAEQNALLQCRDTEDIWACYTTVSPCLHCVKLLMNTSCQRIVFIEPYAHDQASRNLWLASGSCRTWDNLEDLR